MPASFSLDQCHGMNNESFENAIRARLVEHDGSWRNKDLIKSVEDFNADPTDENCKEFVRQLFKQVSYCYSQITSRDYSDNNFDLCWLVHEVSGYVYDVIGQLDMELIDDDRQLNVISKKALDLYKFIENNQSKTVRLDLVVRQVMIKMEGLNFDVERLFNKVVH